MFDYSILITAVPLVVFGFIYFQWRDKQKATLGQMIGGSIAITMYLAVVFIILILLVSYYMSSSIPGFDRSVFGVLGDGDIVIDGMVGIVLTFASFFITFILGGLMYYKLARKTQSTND